MNNLALALDDAGQHAEAIEMYRTVLSVSRRVLGEEHPLLSTSMNNLAALTARASMQRRLRCIARCCRWSVACWARSIRMHAR